MRSLFFLLLSLLCGGPCFASGFSLKGEFLYLKPETEKNVLTTKTTSASRELLTQEQLFLNPHYDPGFRVEAGIPFNCTSRILSRFTYFQSGKNKREISNLPASQSLTATEKFRFYALEFLFAKDVFCAPDMNLALSGGILYSNIRVQHRAIFTPPPPHFFGQLNGDYDSQFWGVGPEIVLNLNYHLPCQFCGLFSIVTEGRGALLSSKIKDRSFENFTIPERNSLKIFRPIWRVIPTLDFKLGLNWVYPCTCFNTALELGYEWIFYQDTIQQKSNLSFQGPYLSANILF